MSRVTPSAVPLLMMTVFAETSRSEPRIAEEPRGGTVIREHGKTNRWLRAAIARKELSDAIAGAGEALPCLLRRFAAAARGCFLERSDLRR